MARAQIGPGHASYDAVIRSKHVVFSVSPTETSEHQWPSQLNTLLAEPPDIAAERRKRHAELYQQHPVRYVLYGAGQLGRTTLAKLRASGVEPVAFADDTPDKQGQVVDGLAAMSPQEVCRKFGNDVVFVVTILNPALNFPTAQHRLQKLTGAQTISFLDLAWIYPDQFLPYGPFEVPEDLLRKAGDIRRGFELLADSESRAQFVGHLRLRLHRDYEDLPPCVADDYFPQNVFPPLQADVVFVDCGAYDGDTLRAFLRQAEEFESIYAFEPDPANFIRLREYVSSLGAWAGRIHLFNAGVGNQRTRLRFHAAGNMGSSFGADGSVEVDVLPIDDVVKANSGHVYLKLDVEGAELDALEGSRNLIQQQRPLMAVSVYHRPDDLWQLPIYIDSLGLNYRTFLRTQGEDGMDAIAYFVPAHV